MAYWRTNNTIHGRQGNIQLDQYSNAVSSKPAFTIPESSHELKYPDCLFVTEPSNLRILSKGVVSAFPGLPSYVNDAIFIEWYETTVTEQGLVVPKYSLEICSKGGFLGNISGDASDSGALYVSSEADFIEAKLIESGTAELSITSSAFIFSEAARNNWLYWSDIGNLDFTIGKDNIAGARPLELRGLTYSLKKLGAKIVAYGESGISFVHPVGKAYALNTVYRTGIKGRNAVAGDESIHFFLDVNGCLFQLTDGIKKLDFSEYLSVLSSNTVLSYDAENGLLYLCDGTHGFIYSLNSGSLGECSPEITGIGSQSGNLYVTASSFIETPSFEICTDIYDFGTLSYKTIYALEIGANVQGAFEASIDFRSEPTVSFSQTNWYPIAYKGNVFITAIGREFRFRLRSTPYEYFEIDYIKVNGVIHRH